MAAKRSASGLSKGENINIRVSPRTKYALELLAKKQHRTLTSVVEWAIDKAILDSSEGLWWYDPHDNDNEKVNLLEEVWDPFESDRLAKLALHYPHLLTYEEDVIWKLIKENGSLWRGKYTNNEWTWEIKEKHLCFDRLRENFETFRQVARGELDDSSLPTWQKEEPKGSLTEDDIPF